MPKQIACMTAREAAEWLADMEYMGGGVHIDEQPLLMGDQTWVNYAEQGLESLEERIGFWEPDLALRSPAPGQVRFTVLRRSSSGKWDAKARKSNGLQTRSIYLCSEVEPPSRGWTGPDLEARPTYSQEYRERLEVGESLPPARIQGQLLEARDLVTLVSTVLTLSDARQSQALSDLREQNKALMGLLQQKDAMMSGVALQALLQSQPQVDEEGRPLAQRTVGELMEEINASFQKRSPQLRTFLRAISTDEDMPAGVRTAAGTAGALMGAMGEEAA